MRVSNIGRVAVVTFLAATGVVGAAGVAGPAAAATCTATWAGAAGGDWATAANWSPAQVPTAGSVVCIDTAGPAVAKGYTATMTALQVTGGSLRVDGSLHTATFTLRLATLRGVGQLSAVGGRTTNVVNGVRIDGGLRLEPDSVLVTGQRAMCGGRYSLCLNGVSVLWSSTIDLQGATIAGATTAEPAVSATGALVVDGTGQTSRSMVDTSAVSVRGVSSGNTLQLDRWAQLTPDGTVNAELMPGPDVVVLPRSITALTDDTYAGPASLRTTDGLDALRTLTTVGLGAYGDLSLPTDITPQSGTLQLQSRNSAVLLRGAAPVTVHGAVANIGLVDLFADLTADSLTSTGKFTITPGGAVTAATTSFTNAPLNFVGDGSVTSSNGLSVDDLYGGAGCARLHADVRMPAGGAVHVLLKKRHPPVRGCSRRPGRSCCPTPSTSRPLPGSPGEQRSC